MTLAEVLAASRHRLRSRRHRPRHRCRHRLRRLHPVDRAPARVGPHHAAVRLDRLRADRGAGAVRHRLRLRVLATGYLTGGSPHTLGGADTCSSPRRHRTSAEPDPPDLAGDRHRHDRVRDALLRADEVRLPAHGADVPGAGRGDRGRHQAGRGAAGRGQRALRAVQAAARRGAHRGGAHPAGGRGRRRGHPAGRARPRPARSPTGSSRPAGSSSRPSGRRSCGSCAPTSGTLAVDLASRIVGESLADEARQRGTVDRFLADLDAVPAAGGRTLDGVGEPRVLRRRGRASGWLRDGRPSGGPGRGGRRDPRGRRELLERQPRLRRALSDPARPGTDRAELLGSLLERQGRRPTPPTLLRTLVAGRWSAPGELLNATERLGVEALLASADAAGRPGRGGGRAVPVRTDRRTATPALAAALGTSTAPVGAAQPARALAAGGQGQAGHGPPGRHRAARVRWPQLRRLADPAGRAGRRAARPADRVRDGRRPALRRGRGAALAARLAQIYGREVEVKVIVDPEVLGGASVRIGHRPVRRHRVPPPQRRPAPPWPESPDDPDPARP